MTENTTTQSEPTEATQANAREIARETMLGDLMQSIIDEMKAMPDVWPKLSESKQDQVIYRVECMSRRVVGKAVEIIAADARPSIAAVVESVTVKDGIKAVLTVSRTSSQRHELVDAQGSAVMIVIADAEPYTGGEKPKSERDQGTLPLGDETPVADVSPATAQE